MKKEIVETVFRLYPKHLVRQIVIYGNRNSRRDIDVFIVLKGSSILSSFDVGKLDVTSIGEGWIEMLYHYLDPIITEVIITGSPIWGDEVIPGVEELAKRRGSLNSAYYLLDTAKIFVEWGKDHLKSNLAAQSAQCLSFAVSFVYFARFYETKKPPISFSKLKEIFRCRLLEKLVRIGKYDDTATSRQMNQMLSEIQELVIITENVIIRRHRSKTKTTE